MDVIMGSVLKHAIVVDSGMSAFYNYQSLSLTGSVAVDN